MGRPVRSLGEVDTTEGYREVPVPERVVKSDEVIETGLHGLTEPVQLEETVLDTPTITKSPACAGL